MRGRTAPTRPSRLLEFLRTEEASGVFLVAASTALVWANSPIRGSYDALWSTVVSVQLDDALLALDLRHWVNEGLMTFFFFAVALEIKREIVVGELRDPRKLAMPAIAALGGMVVPAVIYVLLNLRSGTGDGWGIPVATDIAFALGVLTLVAHHAPLSVRSFLLTLAIVDDIGAIVVIAVFYSGALAPWWLVTSLVIIGLAILFRRLGVTSVGAYVPLGVALWFALLQSGVHPTLAGVILGALTPTVQPSPVSAVLRTLRRIVEKATRVPMREDPPAGVGSSSAADTTSPLDEVETSIHPWTTRAVVPVFALANAGVELSGGAVGNAITSPIGLGVMLGLVVGKPVGIGSAIWLGHRFGFGRLADDMTSRMVLGVGALAGIGFTVSLFVTDLAFRGEEADASRLAVLLASLLAALFGASILRSAGTDAT